MFNRRVRRRLGLIKYQSTVLDNEYHFQRKLVDKAVRIRPVLEEFIASLVLSPRLCVLWFARDCHAVLPAKSRRRIDERQRFT